MGTININVDTFYSNRAYYPYIPAPVFDALESAYLDGKETAAVSATDYAVMMSNLKTADVCREQL